MNKYRVGFKWKNGIEDYLVIESLLSSKEIAEDFKEKDKTGDLISVFVKLIN